MHKFNALILGPHSFVSTLNELKTFLKFNSSSENIDNPTFILFHVNALNDSAHKHLINNSTSIKICAGNKKDMLNDYDAYLELPTTLNEMNLLVEKTIAKNKFNKNSSIKIKNYFLDKNEKELLNHQDYIFLTEKEVQLLELFLDIKKPISKDKILSSVWNYAPDADTHTVETHIYRLRKKIIDKFSDEKFILNNKDGYYL